jgi:hypothetical protein
MNPLYPQSQNPNNPLTLVNQIRSNPTQFLARKGINLPQDINVNDPNAILNYLMQKNRTTQAQYNGAYNKALGLTQMFGR